MRVGEPRESEHADIGGDLKQRDVDDRAGIDTLVHRMCGRAEFARMLVKRKMRGSPAGVLRWAGMKIIGAVT